MAIQKRRTLSKSKKKTINRKKAAKRTTAKASKKMTSPRGKSRGRQRRKEPVGPRGTAVVYEVIETEVFEPEQDEEILEA